MSSDRIEKSVALSDSGRFSRWFGVAINGPFAPGARVTGTITKPEYSRRAFPLLIKRVEPLTPFFWRWHPYSSEPATLIEFTLEDAPEGTLLKVVESGFDGIPLTRRVDAFRGNERGGETRMRQIRQYVDEAE